MNSTNPLELTAPIGQSKKVSKWKKELTIPKILATFLLILATLFFIFPFYWVVSGAFKLQTVATTIPPEWFPAKPTLQNWTELFKNPVERWMFNSFIIAFCEMAAICIVSSCAGYVLAKKSFMAEGLSLRCLLPLWHCLSKLFLSRCLRCLQILGGSTRIKGLFYQRLAGHLESS